MTQIVGICGGYQMLGSKIHDKNGLESGCRQTRGLNILPVETSLKTDKILSQVKAKDLLSGLGLTGYEIHHGRTRITGNCQPAFEVFERNDKKTKYPEGAVTNDRRILGTYIHGIFDAEPFRRDFLNRLRKKKSWPVLTASGNFNLDKEFDKLAKLVRDNIDTDLLYKILERGLK